MTGQKGGFMDDLISRKALCEYALNQKDKSITPNDIMRFPSAQPEKRTDKCTETHACDLISRQDAIEAMEDVDWYHINSNGQLVHGANSKEDEPLYKAEDVYKVLNDMPSAQSEIVRKPIKGYEGIYEVDNLARVFSVDRIKAVNDNGRICLEAHTRYAHHRARTQEGSLDTASRAKEHLQRQNY